MKMLVRFILVLSLLFVSSGNYLYANIGMQGSVLTMHPAKPDVEKRLIIKAIEVEEEDENDDRLTSFKKNIHFGEFIHPYIYAHSPGRIQHNHKESFSKDKYSFYSLPEKYILHQVFRI